MALPQVHPFRAHGRDYEVRVWREADWTVVQSFEAGRPVGHRFGVADEIRADMQAVAGESAVQHLVEIARSDVQNAR